MTHALKKNAISFASNVVIGVASTAPAYSLAAALRELSHFRAVFIEFCWIERITVDAREAQLVHAMIDETMSTAAVEIANPPVGQKYNGPGSWFKDLHDFL